jgi:urease accessory protein
MPPVVTARKTATITVMTTRITTVPATIIRTITAITITITATTSTVHTSTTIIPMLMTTNKSARAAVSGGMTEREAAALYRLMTWLSPAFPVGGFSYSSGIEWAVEVGDITDAGSLRDWLGAMLTDGSAFCDGVFLVQAHRAVEAGDDTTLRDIVELAAAFVSSRERQLETSAQGRAFMEIARTAWSCEALETTLIHCNGTIVYPVAVGLVAAAHEIPLAPTLHAYLHALVSNWVSAASRLVPLGQTDSQRVLAGLEALVAATANRAISATVDDLGSATFRADLASLRHETQYTRLFRS